MNKESAGDWEAESQAAANRNCVVRIVGRSGGYPPVRAGRRCFHAVSFLSSSATFLGRFGIGFAVGGTVLDFPVSVSPQLHWWRGMVLATPKPDDAGARDPAGHDPGTTIIRLPGGSA